MNTLDLPCASCGHPVRWHYRGGQCEDRVPAADGAGDFRCACTRYAEPGGTVNEDIEPVELACSTFVLDEAHERTAETAGFGMHPRCATCGRPKAEHWDDDRGPGDPDAPDEPGGEGQPTCQRCEHSALYHEGPADSCLRRGCRCAQYAPDQHGPIRRCKDCGHQAFRHNHKRNGHETACADCGCDRYNGPPPPGAVARHLADELPCQRCRHPIGRHPGVFTPSGGTDDEACVEPDCDCDGYVDLDPPATPPRPPTLVMARIPMPATREECRASALTLTEEGLRHAYDPDVARVFLSAAAVHATLAAVHDDDLTEVRACLGQALEAASNWTMPNELTRVRWANALKRTP